MTDTTVDLERLRFIIHAYQGTCVPLNRTSLEEVFSEVERLRAESATMRELVVAVRHFRGAVNDAMAHQSRCQDSPCDRCDRTVFVEDAAESALFDALDRLDAAEKARTATPEGMQSGPSSQPPRPDQAT